MASDDEITTAVYPPRTAYNWADKWCAVVRKRGWLVNAEDFDSEQEAHAWLEEHKNDPMSESVKELYLKTARKCAQ